MSRIVQRPPPSILVVDDIAANRELLLAQLEDLGYDLREARDGIEALEAVDESEPDLILLDVEMPRLDGIGVCERLKAHPLRRLIPIVILTALRDRATRLRGISAGADDFLTKPFDRQELLLRVRVLLRDRQLNKRLDATQDVLFALARAVEARDRYTIYHAERVGRFAQEIGAVLGLDQPDRDVLYEGGVLHDLGKIAIPDAILLKPGRLSEDEYATMRTHAEEGERICLSLRSVTDYLPIIRHHHEHLDGSGYPDHLHGGGIPLGARVVAVADGWDAMTSDRPYRAGMERDQALRELRTGAGTQWDPEIVGAFVHLLDRGVVDTVVREQLRVV